MRPNEFMQLKIIQRKAPIADAFNGGMTIGPINTAGYDQALFLINLGAATGGTARGKVYAYGVDVAAGTNKQAVGYWIRCGAGDAPDTEGTWTRYEAGAELTTLAANNHGTQWLVAVDIVEVQNVMVAAGYVGTGIQLIITESVDDPIVASATVILHPTFNKDTQANAILA